MIIITADDWGRSRGETDAALACYREGRITSLSAMVFMQDSSRAAELTRGTAMDVGLHLNLSQLFTGEGLSPTLTRCHSRIMRFLPYKKYTPLLYNPFLREQFSYTYQAQIQEFRRLYGKHPSHINGHQHMHLCSNMLLDGIIGRGEKVRRSFSFLPGERNIFNRTYRRMVDWKLARKYKMTDYFFALSKQYPKDRLHQVSRLSREATVELMTHPAKSEEYAFLIGGEFLETLGNLERGSYAEL